MGENRRQSDCSSCQTQDAQVGLVGGSAGSASARPTKHDHEPGTPPLQQRHCERSEPHNSQHGQKGKIILMSFKCIFLSVMQKKRKKSLKHYSSWHGWRQKTEHNSHDVPASIPATPASYAERITLKMYFVRDISKTH